MKQTALYMICPKSYKLVTGEGRIIWIPISTNINASFSDNAILAIRKVRDAIDFSARNSYTSRQEYTKHSVVLDTETGNYVSAEVMEI